jgi:methylenetetrahydrofolate reductase (NADPH)
MNLSSVYGPGKFGLSFELFPPKSSSAEEDLFRHLDELVKFRPDFITCTYGAGGSTREKTLEIVAEAHRRYRLPVASHLTCVGSTREELRAYLAEAHRRGVEMIVALRGDPPRGQASFRAVDGGLSFASELVTLVRGEFSQFRIAVAGYPETHREAASPEADLENLRRKVAAGGDIVITQLFYDNRDFFRFRERCKALNIEAPIVPGILPITNLAQVQRISSMCGARLPAALTDALAAAGDDADAQFAAGVAYCARQTQELVDAEAPGLHFYVLNKSPATCAVLRDVRLPKSAGPAPHST